jgi:hypothetical protein
VIKALQGCRAAGRRSASAALNQSCFESRPPTVAHRYKRSQEQEIRKT